MQTSTLNWVMIGDKETSEERGRRFSKHLLEVAVAFKKLRISPIITHPVQGYYYQFIQRKGQHKRLKACRVEVCT